MSGNSMNWHRVSEEQSIIIEHLSGLCHSLINELAQYKDIELEEQRLNAIIKERENENHRDI